MQNRFLSLLVVLIPFIGLSEAVDVNHEPPKGATEIDDSPKPAISSGESEGSDGGGGGIRGTKRDAGRSELTAQTNSVDAALDASERALAAAPVVKKKDKNKRRRHGGKAWTNGNVETREDNGLDPTTTTTAQSEWKTFDNSRPYPQVAPIKAKDYWSGYNGVKELGCNYHGGSGQALYIGTEKFGICQDFHPCTCGVNPQKFARICGNICRPFCSRNAPATPALCPLGFEHIYYANGTMRRIPPQSLRSVRTADRTPWPPQWGYPPVGNTPGMFMSGFNPYVRPGG